MGNIVNAKENLYNFVEKLRWNYGINSYPINIANIYKSNEPTELIFYNFKTPGFCGAALPGEKSNTIILNSNRTVDELNFDCGHEVIHLTKHKNQNNDIFTCFERSQNKFLEWEANEGSAELLLPYRLFLPILKENWSTFYSFTDIYRFKRKIAKEFHIPISVVENRIENLKYETHQFLNGKNLNDLEILSNNQQKNRNIIIQSLNDIETIDLMKQVKNMTANRQCS